LKRLKSLGGGLITINAHEIEKSMKARPHVVLVGAGATIAAIPHGDKNGKKASVMQGFIDSLGLRRLLNGISLRTTSDNIEDIYSELAASGEHDAVVQELENAIREYFSELEIPDELTVYDFLVLGLTKKDLIASFNWDPLLYQAWSRSHRITSNLPQIVFLHGCVALGICKKDKRVGPICHRCEVCGEPFEQSKLLFPIREKNYQDDMYIQNAWKRLDSKLRRAYMFTIFGYSAPKTDQAALDLLKNSWGPNTDRKLEEIEIIDIKPEEELENTWSDFVFSHHFKTTDNLFDSSIGRYPRRSCEATFERLMNAEFLDAEKGFNIGMSIEEVKAKLSPLIEDEERNEGDVLHNPYI